MKGKPSNWKHFLGLCKNVRYNQRMLKIVREKQNQRDCDYRRTIREVKVAGFEDGGNWGHLIGTTSRWWKMQGNGFIPRASRKECNSTSIFILAHWNLWATSNLQNCKTVNFCYFQLKKKKNNKYALPFPSGLKSSYWKISCYPYRNPLVCYLLFFTCCF